MQIRRCVPTMMSAALLVGCAGVNTQGTGGPDDPEARPARDALPTPVFMPTSDGGSSVDDGGSKVVSDATREPRPAPSDTLVAIVRDFRLYDPRDALSNPDFENVPAADQTGTPQTSYHGPWDDREIVAERLGADGKPVYRKDSGTTLTTHGRAAFDAWFRDVAGVNERAEYPLKLARSADGVYEYDSEKVGLELSSKDTTKMFFPIDDGSAYATSFGNQGDPHNYCFTVELRTQFTYKGGEYFRFRGDDDVFVYIDGRLVINLGGIHAPEAAEVNVDGLGLTVGKTYALDFFSAERHKTGSNILFSTTLELRPTIVR